jgi:adenylate kinase
MLQARDTRRDCVLEFQVAEEELLKRLMSRGRADDTDEVICNRMKVYRIETQPLLDHYRENLTTVDAVGAQVEVLARALQALGIVDDHASANGPLHSTA